MIISGKLLAWAGLVLLLAGWRLDLLFALTGIEQRLLEEGGTLHYRFHLERDRMIALWVGASAVVLGTLLYLGGRIIVRGEAQLDP